MAETAEFEVTELQVSDGEINSKPEINKTKSVQMLDGHDVEEELLEPLCFGKCIVKCPCALCIVIMFILFIVAIIDGAYYEQSDISSMRPYLVESNEYVIAFDGYALAAEFIADNSEDNSTALPQTQNEDYWLYQHMFTLKDYKNDLDINNPEKTDYWILTPENIEIIIKYENMIVDDPEWKNQFCYVGADPLSTNYSCSPAVSSLARQIYDEPDFESMTTDDIKEWVKNEGYENVAFYFNPGLNETGQTYIYRSFIYSALPIATEWKTINGTTIHLTEYKNSMDNYDEQEVKYLEWATQLFIDITVENDADLIDGDLQIITLSLPAYYEYNLVLLTQSTGYFVFSILIVVAYMSFHLSSIFLAICALFQILMSFPLAYFFYRVIFGIEEFGVLSMLIIFVLLGVGADDVFVFTDAWLQSVYFVRKVDNLETVDDPEKSCWENDAKSCTSGCGGCCGENETKKNIVRMSFAFRRAAKAMLVTQATTFFAFLATAASPIMGIAAFGIWAAIVVAMNYLLVISLYPSFLIFHHVYLKKWETMILCCCCNLCCRSGNNNNDAPSVPKKTSVGDDEKPRMMRQLTVEEQAEEYRCFEKFLGTKYSSFISKWSKIIVIIFGLLFILAAVFGLQMEAQSEQEAGFADDHFMQRAVDKAQEFSASETDNLVQIGITFGIDGVDRDGYSRWDSEEFGEVVWDESFDMSSIEAQQYLMTICNETKSSSLVYRSDKVTCPIEDFKLYLQSINEVFPYDGTGKASFEEVYYEFLESGYGFNTVNSALSYIELTDEGEYIQRFYAMLIYTKLQGTDNSDVQRDGREDWDNFIDEFSADCPDDLCGSVNNVGLSWCWLETQRAFVQSATQGILIAMPLALIILLISTQNWIISIFAVLDIIGVMLCELSIMYFAGWKFGTSESVAIVIIIGFSVDYVVHIANAYLESTASTREERLSFAMLTMGISVVSGAVTTFGAGFFLIFPDMIFFYKMGIIMISTVFLSIAWAMLFFPAIVAWIGPEGDKGDVKKWFKCLPCYKNEGDDDENNENENDKTNEDDTDDTDEIEMGRQNGDNHV